jgi:DNA-binding NarL/FixJ family response regulator
MLKLSVLVAFVLGISFNIYDKLQVHCKTQAVAKALREKLV